MPFIFIDYLVSQKILSKDLLAEIKQKTSQQQKLPFFWTELIFCGRAVQQSLGREAGLKVEQYPLIQHKVSSHQLSGGRQVYFVTGREVSRRSASPVSRSNYQCPRESKHSQTEKQSMLARAHIQPYRTTTHTYTALN